MKLFIFKVFPLFNFFNCHVDTTKHKPEYTNSKDKARYHFTNIQMSYYQRKSEKEIADNSCYIFPIFVTKTTLHNFLNPFSSSLWALCAINVATKGSSRRHSAITAITFPKIFSIKLNNMSKCNTSFHSLQAFLLLSFVISLFAFTTNPANASVESSMESFWGGLGDNANYSQGGAYKTQTNTYYSGPSVYSRSKVMNVNPVSIQAPRLRGGCNGIDMFTGSFSHINSDQFLKPLKQVGNNAQGLVYQLALDTISPTLSTQIKSILATIEKINSMNLNSCDIAAGAVGGAYSLFKQEKEKNAFCKTAQTISGRASDWAKGANNCGAGGETNSTIKNTNTPELNDVKPSDINFAWEALEGLGLSDELKEVFQSITGTIIKKLPADDNVPATFITFPAKATDSQFIDRLLGGGSIPVYKCTDTALCLDVTPGDIQLKPDKSLQVKINNILNNITDKLKNNTVNLEPSEEILVDKVSTISIISMLKVKVLNSGVESAKLENIALAEIIAVELLYIYIDEVFTSIMQGTEGMKKGGKDLEKFAENLTKTHKIIEARRKINLQKLALTNQIIQQIHEIEKVLSKSSNSSLF